MDPFSVSATCIGLIASIGQLTVQISSFISSVRDARRDMDAVSRELHSLSICLALLRDDSTKIQFPPDLLDGLISILKNCDLVTSEIAALLQRLSSANVARRVQWTVSTSGEVNKLRSSLESHKTALNIALIMTTLLVTSDIKADTQIIKETTLTIEEQTAQIPSIKQDTAQIAGLAQEISSLRAQLNQRNEADGKSQVLQRFLNDSTGYAESFVDATDWEDFDTIPESSGNCTPTQNLPNMSVTEIHLGQAARLELSEQGDVEKIHAEDDELEFAKDASAPKVPTVGNSDLGLPVPEVAEPSGTATDTAGENLRNTSNTHEESQDQIEQTLTNPDNKTSSSVAEHPARPMTDDPSDDKIVISLAEYVDVTESASSTTFETSIILPSHPSCPQISDRAPDLAATDEPKNQPLSIDKHALDQETSTDTGPAINTPHQAPDSNLHSQGVMQGPMPATLSTEQAEVEAAKSRRLQMPLSDRLELDQRLRIAIAGIDDANFEDDLDIGTLKAKCSRTTVKDKEYIKDLLNQGANPNARAFKFNLLSVEIHIGQRADVVALLLTYGAKIHPQNFGSAILSDMKEVIEVLLQNGADAEVNVEWRALSEMKEYIKTTPLYCAASCSNQWATRVKMMKPLLEHGVNVNKVAGPKGSALQGVLSVLAYKTKQLGVPEAVELLLEYGADANADSEYDRPLYTAAGWGCNKSVELLLRHGADVNARGGDRGSALEYAIREAPEATKVQVIDLLLKNGADANADIGNDKPLYTAVVHGCTKSVELLLRHGADVNARCREHGSALEHAIRCAPEGKAVEVIEILLENGAEVSAGHTRKPLYIAAANGHKKLVKVLLDYGAPIDERGGPRGTALHTAVYHCFPKVVKILLERGADTKAAVREFGALKIRSTVARGDSDRREIVALFLQRAISRPISV